MAKAEEPAPRNGRVRALLREILSTNKKARALDRREAQLRLELDKIRASCRHVWGSAERFACSICGYGLTANVMIGGPLAPGRKIGERRGR